MIERTDTVGAIAASTISVYRCSISLPTIVALHVLRKRMLVQSTTMGPEHVHRVRSFEDLVYSLPDWQTLPQGKVVLVVHEECILGTKRVSESALHPLKFTCNEWEHRLQCISE